jgi:hypothetical protein
VEQQDKLRLLHPDNKLFLDDRSRMPGNEPEIFKNINRRYKLPPIIAEEDRPRAFMYQSLIVVIFFMFSVLILGYPFIKAHQMLNGAYISDHNKTTIAIYFLAGILTLMICARVVQSTYVFLRYGQSKTISLYKDLLKDGKIVVGEITDTTLSARTGTEISYRFEGENKRVINQLYILDSYERDVKTGEKVYVLYLNKQLNILL